MSEQWGAGSLDADKTVLSISYPSSLQPGLVHILRAQEVSTDGWNDMAEKRAEGCGDQCWRAFHRDMGIGIC